MADIVPGCIEVSIDPQQLKNSLLVKRTSDNVVGFRVKIVDVAASEITPLVGCAEFNLGDGQIVRYGIGLNDNGNAAIILFNEAD